MTLTETVLQYVTLNENQTDKVSVIVVCGGSSRRMNGIDKMFAEIGGIPVCVRSIQAFQNNAEVDDIIVVTKAESILKIQQLCEKYGLSKVTDIVEGGDCRQRSVKNGLDRIAENGGTVLIHDGARPLVSNETIVNVIDGARRLSAVTCAVKVKDTVKKIGLDGRVIDTPDRSSLVAVQTPQGFLTELYRKAVGEFEAVLDGFTDDCSVVERAGYPVYTVEGDYSNIKITTAEDILTAEALLKGAAE